MDIAGRVVYVRGGVAARCIVTVGVRDVVGNVADHQMEVFSGGDIRFDGEPVASASDLARRLIDADDMVTVTIHPDPNRYTQNTRAEFVTHGR